MAVKTLDHVTLRTPRLDESAKFYSEVLGMRADRPANVRPGEQMIWMVTEDGRPVLHLIDCAMDMSFLGEIEPEDVRDGGSGMVHHIAFNCDNYESFRDRLAKRGEQMTLHALPEVGLQQIFLRDPDEVLVELNFFT